MPPKRSGSAAGEWREACQRLHDLYRAAEKEEKEPGANTAS